MKLDRKGKLKIWQKPRDSDVYALGCDVAQGLESGDFSTIFVINQRNEQVASYCAHVDPDVFGRKICKLGKYYNNALVAVEINNHGWSTLSRIKELDYSNIYEREVKDEHSDKLLKKIGWLTTKKTKPLMLDEFVAAVRDDIILLRDESLLIEMSELYIDENGDVDLNGKDRVVAACIALQAIKQVPKEIYKATNPDQKKRKYKTLMDRHKGKKYETYFD